MLEVVVNPGDGFHAWIVGALEGAVVVGGLSVFGAALFNLGVPRDSVLRYETAIRTGRFVLIAHGTLFDTTLAKEILTRTQPETLDHHLHEESELRTAVPADLVMPPNTLAHAGK